MDTWCFSETLQLYDYLCCKAEPEILKSRLLELHGIAPAEGPHGKYHFSPVLIWNEVLLKDPECKMALEKRKISSPEELCYRFWDWMDDERQKRKQRPIQDDEESSTIQ